MSKLTSIAIAATFAASALATGAQAEEATEPFDLSALTCWEVTTLPEDEHAFVIALMIGYLQGQAGSSVMTPQQIVDQVETLDANCADTPEAPAISALK